VETTAFADARALAVTDPLLDRASPRDRKL